MESPANVDNDTGQGGISSGSESSSRKRPQTAVKWFYRMSSVHCAKIVPYCLLFCKLRGYLVRRIALLCKLYRPWIVINCHLHSAELTKYLNWLLSFSMAPAMPPPAQCTEPSIPRLAENRNLKSDNITRAQNKSSQKVKKIKSIIILKLVWFSW